MTTQPRSTTIDSIHNSLRIQADALDVLADGIDAAAIVRAAEMLVSAPRIITVGSGSSGFAAAKMSHSLCCIEQPAKFMPPAEAIHGGLGAVQPGDAVLMVTRGGATSELLPIIDVTKKKGATLIGLTENLESVLAKESDIVIPLIITRESDPLNIMATTSNLVITAIFDALLAAMMTITNYRLEQFGLIHPGGAVGARLSNEE